MVRADSLASDGKPRIGEKFLELWVYVLEPSRSKESKGTTGARVMGPGPGVMGDVVTVEIFQSRSLLSACPEFDQVLEADCGDGAGIAWCWC